MNDNGEKSIAFYIGGLCIGGAERVICNLAEYFYGEGYRVTMVTKVRDEKEYELNPGIRRIIADITPEEAQLQLLQLALISCLALLQWSTTLEQEYLLFLFFTFSMAGNGGVSLDSLFVLLT